MNIFQYLLTLGILSVLYGFIIPWLNMLLILPFVALKIDRIGLHVIKIFDYYIYTSILGLLTIVALQNSNSIFYSILLIILGLFFTFSTIAGGMYEGEKTAIQNNDYVVLKTTKYDGYILFGSLVFFLIVLFFPFTAKTLPVRILYQIIEWVSKLPIIGYIIGIFGFFTMLGIIYQVLVMGIMGLVSLFGKLKKN